MGDQEVVVGWRRGTGRRADHIGSLLLAVNNPAGELVYIGNVGTGFTQATLDDLRTRFQPLQRDTPTIAADISNVVWLEPRLVGEVSFTEGPATAACDLGRPVLATAEFYN
jgi:bifunctional non-homologous end joining protein LigD